LKRSELAFVGDVHLDREDPLLDDFLRFLDRLGRRCSRIVLMGDLFNVWIGQPELEQPHHRAVVERLRALRASGVVVRYLEGNRDFRIGPLHVGGALDDATLDGFEERFGGRRLFAVHGDLANAADRQYRTWRKLSRSLPFWALFNLLPARSRSRLADRVERRLRRTNLDFKHTFPDSAIRDYAGAILDRGFDGVVLGHFHVERHLVLEPPGPRGEVWVLPLWKDAQRYLRVTETGEIGFAETD